MWAPRDYKPALAAKSLLCFHPLKAKQGITTAWQNNKDLLLYRPRDWSPERGKDLFKSRHRIRIKTTTGTLCFPGRFFRGQQSWPWEISSSTPHFLKWLSVQVQLHLPGDSPEIPHTEMSVRIKSIYSHSGERNIHRTNVRNDWLETRRPIMKAEFQVRNGSSGNPGSRLFQSRGPDVDGDFTQCLAL